MACRHCGVEITQVGGAWVANGHAVCPVARPRSPIVRITTISRPDVYTHHSPKGL